MHAKSCVCDFIGAGVRIFFVLAVLIVFVLFIILYSVVLIFVLVEVVFFLVLFIDLFLAVLGVIFVALHGDVLAGRAFRRIGVNECWVFLEASLSVAIELWVLVMSAMGVSLRL
jgi:hypothetical protein